MQVKSALFVSLIALSMKASAQDATPENASTVPQNFIKLNVLSLPLKNFHLQYERVLSKRVSVAIGGRLMPTSGIPFKSVILDAVGTDGQDTRDLIDQSEIGNIAITPEVRFYLGKGYGKGFYIAPYYRYAKFSTNTVTVSFSEPNGPRRSVNLSGELSGHSGGLMFGAQWFLSKAISLDWWIIGAHYGNGKGSFTGIPSPSLTPGEQAEIRQTLEDIDVPLIDKAITVTANSIDVKTDGAFGGLRGGLLLGVRF